MPKQAPRDLRSDLRSDDNQRRVAGRLMGKYEGMKQEEGLFRALGHTEGK